MSKRKFRIASRPAVSSADRRGQEMNAAALRVLAEEMAKREVGAKPTIGGVVRHMPDGSVWTQCPDKLYIVAETREDKHGRNLREAIARKQARELAEKTRLIPEGRKVDKRETQVSVAKGSSQVDTSTLGSNKMFGTQGRWD